MLWENIKKILAKEGGKCIIIEENQPAYVVTKLETEAEAAAPTKKDEPEMKEIEKVNQELTQWEEEAKEDVKEDIKIEDLPF